MDMMCQAAVQAATVVHHITYHPRGGRAADDEEDVVHPRAAAVPEIVQGMDETRIGRVETGQFVDEDDKPLVFVPVLLLLRV